MCISSLSDSFLFRLLSSSSYSRCCDKKSCGNRNETPSDPVIIDRYCLWLCPYLPLSHTRSGRTTLTCLNGNGMPVCSDDVPSLLKQMVVGLNWWGLKSCINGSGLIGGVLRIKHTHKHVFHIHLYVRFSDEDTDLCRRGIISCSVTTSFLVDSCATSDMSVCFLYVMQNTELFTSRGCLSVGMSLSFFLSVCRDEGLKLSLPYLPPLFSTFLPFLLQHEKNGSWGKKEVAEKKWNEIQPNFNLISSWQLF